MKRAQGVQLGRPREIPGSTVARIRELHDAGLGLVAIARKLNEEGIETPRERPVAPRRCREGALVGASFVRNVNCAERDFRGGYRLSRSSPRSHPSHPR